jgi:uncharacterized protein (DUF1330 family)
MSAFMVYLRDRILDPAELKIYEDSAPAASSGHPMTPQAYYGAVETLEGPAVDGAVIIQFPSMDDALAAYKDPRYQEALKHRLKGAEYRVFVTEGL